jgi:3-dehydroquinate synthase
MLRLKISLPRQPLRSEINIGSAIRLNIAGLLRESFGSLPQSVCLISNERVLKLFGAGIKKSLKAGGLRPETWLMPEGERFKSFRTLEAALEFLAAKRFERNDVVVALGGGVVGDVAGLAASMYLRGIPFVQVPTTLLAQIDASVGGKTGINLPVGKNLVGTFHQPSLVVIDTQTLSSLPERELVAGFCEMVKQSAVASSSLFKKTVSFLGSERRRCGDFDNSAFQSLIRDHCRFKASIVVNDERESTTRNDSRSRRILNFGHTTAHALESVTGYKKFRHGEAVGYGVLVAGEISKNLGLLSNGELESLKQAVALCGPLPKALDVDQQKVLNALRHDKKSVAGQINWVLLNGIGSPQIVNGRDINETLLRRALEAGLRGPERRTGH